MSSASVAELNASDGVLVRVIRAKSYDFDFDSGPIDFSGQNVWVLNPHNESVTELDASSGALIRVVHLHIKALSTLTPDMYYSPLDMAISTLLGGWLLRRASDTRLSYPTASAWWHQLRFRLTRCDQATVRGMKRGFSADLDPDFDASVPLGFNAERPR
jgi:hypothetical protein